MQYCKVGMYVVMMDGDKVLEWECVVPIMGLDCFKEVSWRL